MRSYGSIMFWNDLEFIKPQNLGSLLIKSSKSNFNLRSQSSYLVRSYLITTLKKMNESATLLFGTQEYVHKNKN